MVRSKPLALPNGGILLPVYHETGYDTEKVGADTTSLFLRFDPQKKNWTQTTRVASRMGNLQPAVARLSETHIVAYCRRGGDYSPGDDGYVVRTESHDDGKTWSEGVETEFPNPNAAVELLGLESGNLLLIYNDSMSQRTPLAAALSTDGGKTFPNRVNIAEGDNSYAYPYAIQTEDGLIRLIFTSNGRTVITWRRLPNPPSNPTDPTAEPRPCAHHPVATTHHSLTRAPSSPQANAHLKTWSCRHTRGCVRAPGCTHLSTRSSLTHRRPARPQNHRHRGFYRTARGRCVSRA